MLRAAFSFRDQLLTTVLPLLVTFALITTGIGAAYARGQAPAADQFVLCSTQGPVMIYLDDQGNPTAAPHLCPDSALNLVQGLFLTALPASRDTHTRPAQHSAARTHVHDSQPPLSIRTRAPPA